MMRRFVTNIVAITVCVIISSSVAASDRKRDESGRAIYAPPPGYPTLPDGRRPKGKGVFVLHMDQKTGLVRTVSIQKSTGSPLLDREAVATFKRWKFFPGKVRSTITIPISFDGQFKSSHQTMQLTATRFVVYVAGNFGHARFV